MIADQEGRALDEAKALGQREHLRRLHDRLLRIAAMTLVDHHAIARGDPGHPASHLDHLARRLETRREGQRGLELIHARGHEDIGEINAGRPEPHPDLSRHQSLRGDLFDGHALGRPELAADHRATQKMAPSWRSSHCLRLIPPA